MSSTPAVPQPPAHRPLADVITRTTVTVIIAITALISFVFSFGNVTLLCLSVGVPRVIAWLVSPAVDLSVTGLLLGINVLVQRRPADAAGSGVRLWKLRLMLGSCGLLTVARSLDDEHRQANGGRPLSRDALKSKLSCSTDRASALIKILRADAMTPVDRREADLPGSAAGGPRGRLQHLPAGPGPDWTQPLADAGEVFHSPVPVLDSDSARVMQ